MPPLCFWVEVETQAQIPEALCQFHVFGAQIGGVKPSGIQDVLAAHRSITSIKLARRGFPFTRAHISVLFLKHGFFPACPRVETGIWGSQEWANDYRKRILDMQ